MGFRRACDAQLLAHLVGVSHIESQLGNADGARPDGGELEEIAA